VAFTAVNPLQHFLPNPIERVNPDRFPFAPYNCVLVDIVIDIVGADAKNLTFPLGVPRVLLDTSVDVKVVHFLLTFHMAPLRG